MSMPAARQASSSVAPSGTSAATPSTVTPPSARAPRRRRGMIAARGGSGTDRVGVHQRCSARTRSSAAAADSIGGRGRLAEAADRRVAHRLRRARRAARSSRPSPCRRRRPPARRRAARSCRTVPTRHGTHWPHDSSRKNAAMRVSSVGRGPRCRRTPSPRPSPSVAPAARAPSNVSGTSSWLGADERCPPRRRAARPAACGPPTPPAQVEQLAQRHAERHLVEARRARRGPTGRTAACRWSRPCRCAPTPPPPSSRMSSTLTSVSTLLTTVGLPNRPACGGERRLDARLAAVALDRVEQRRLLAADVGAGAAAHLDVEAHARAQHVVAEQPGGRAPAPMASRMRASRQRVLAADVEEAVLAAASRGRDGHAPRPRANGSLPISTRSLKVPGSDSSALHTT